MVLWKFLGALLFAYGGTLLALLYVFITLLLITALEDS